jgi:hypothetical protein
MEKENQEGLMLAFFSGKRVFVIVNDDTKLGVFSYLPQGTPAPAPGNSDNQRKNEVLPSAMETAGPEPLVESEFAIPKDMIEVVEKGLTAQRWSIPIYKGNAFDVCIKAYAKLCELKKFGEPTLLRFEAVLVPVMEKLTSSNPVTTWNAEVMVSLSFVHPFVFSSLTRPAWSVGASR